MPKTSNDIEQALAAYGHRPVKYDFVLKQLLPIVRELKQTLEARIAALEERPTLKHAGSFRESQQYSEGSLVTRAGSLWLAERTTTDIPGQPESGWRLVVKSGHAA